MLDPITEYRQVIPIARRERAVNPNYPSRSNAYRYFIPETRLVEFMSVERFVDARPCGDCQTINTIICDEAVISNIIKQSVCPNNLDEMRRCGRRQC